MTAVLVRYIWPLSAEILAPCITRPGIRQTDWRIWTMMPCVLDQLERVLLRDLLIFHNDCDTYTIKTSITDQLIRTKTY